MINCWIKFWSKFCPFKINFGQFLTQFLDQILDNFSSIFGWFWLIVKSNLIDFSIKWSWIVGWFRVRCWQNQFELVFQFKCPFSRYHLKRKQKTVDAILCSFVIMKIWRINQLAIVQLSFLLFLAWFRQPFSLRRQLPKRPRP